MTQDRRHRACRRDGEACDRVSLLGAVVVGSLTLALLATAGCTRFPSVGRLSVSGVIQPAIVPSLTERGTDIVERDFVFQETQVQIRVPVDRAVYTGAAGARKSAIFLGKKEPPGWVADYYRAFVGEKHQEEFYASLAGALHQVRQQQNLDTAEYVELVTSMAQSMEYRVDPGNLAPKFPIETFGDGYGDCDDKALLAAAILARDGYDVAILMFAPEKHVALGIRAPGLDYKGTGYAYVEMTEPSLVGVPAEELSGGTKLASQPEVIKVDSGEDAYAAGEDILYIQQRLDEIEAAQMRWKDEIDGETAALKALDASLRKQKDALGSITDRSTLAAAIEEYNADVGDYNSRVTRLDELVDRYNDLVRATRYAAENRTARPQISQRLRALEL